MALRRSEGATFTHGHAEYEDEYDDEDEGRLFALLDTRKDPLLISL